MPMHSGAQGEEKEEDFVLSPFAHSYWEVLRFSFLLCFSILYSSDSTLPYECFQCPPPTINDPAKYPDSCSHPHLASLILSYLLQSLLSKASDNVLTVKSRALPSPHLLDFFLALASFRCVSPSLLKLSLTWFTRRHDVFVSPYTAGTVPFCLFSQHFLIFPFLTCMCALSSVFILIFSYFSNKSSLSFISIRFRDVERNEQCICELL